MGGQMALGCLSAFFHYLLSDASNGLNAQFKAIYSQIRGNSKQCLLFITIGY